MYGTTMKNYNASKAFKKEKTTLFNAKSIKEKKTRKEEAPKTRYMKINEKKADIIEQSKTASFETVKEGFSRKEFPIASIIFTAIATMLLLLFTTGVI